MTPFEIIKKARQILLDAGIEEAENDARLLFEFSSQTGRTWYFMHMRDSLSLEQEEHYMNLIQKRAQRIPLQYITGHQEFMGIDFRVNEATLIPRQDTETLVEETLSYLKEGSRILDMCTGSGCILISLLSIGKQKGIAGLLGTGADISQRALEAARLNAEDNCTCVEFVQSDLFTNISGKYDIIVSNPPYIPSDVIPKLMPEVALHEPIAALDGKEDGLYFYREIVSRAGDYLNPGGVLLFEIGYDQGKDVADMLTYAGFKNVRVIRDLAHNDRVVIGEL